MKKRVFAVLLTLCMVLTMMPAMAWAAEGDNGENPQISVCPDGQTKYAADSGRIEGVTDWNSVSVYYGDNVIDNYEVALMNSDGGTVAKNSDGTFTFTTNGCGEKYLTIKYEDKTAEFTILIPDPQGDELRTAVKDVKLKLSTKIVKTRSGKKAVKLTWTCKSDIQLDGVEIYRSAKKTTGYGKKPVSVTRKKTYTNTSVKAGKRYYYRVRGYIVVDSEKVYTPYSNTTYRTVK